MVVPMEPTSPLLAPKAKGDKEEGKEEVDGKGEKGGKGGEGDGEGNGEGDGEGGGEDGRLVEDESKEEGVASLSTWIAWVQAAGGCTVLMAQLYFLASDRFCYVSCEWWLAQWTQAAESSINVNLGAFGDFEMPSQVTQWTRRCGVVVRVNWGGVVVGSSTHTICEINLKLIRTTFPTRS